VQSFVLRFGYLAVFALLAAAGVGVPVPEELTQLTAGALSHEGLLDLRLAIPVCWVGIVAGDTILFLIARRHGPRLLRSRPARKVLTPERRARLEDHYARHAFLTIAAARHLGGFRFAAFSLAGATGVPLATFVTADALSGLVSVPLVVWVGYVSWQHLSHARHEVRIVELAVLAAVALAVAALLAVRRLRRSRAA
jgi:membrane protein DedA with SNARE-associated domain